MMTKPKWTRTDTIYTLCASYFPDFQYSDTILIDDQITNVFEQTDDTVKEYFSYMLLDFSFSDSSLEKAPLGHALQIAEALEFPKTFRQILKKEQKLTVKELKNLIKKGIAEVSALSESDDESILTDQ